MTAQWVKLPSGKYINMARVFFVVIIGEYAEVYSDSPNHWTSVERGDADFLRAWLDVMAES